ncbi:MAG: hypothetical protein CFH17_00006 [Alphaproteobacteria bacterium MarineAlpha5_Bin7]|nr:MAG: hypothetical protein CFH17_00006 [Alphaproteobacteria bacterium MarineAlpha5_Bin7]|tara:strand:- start:7086 stop:7715 length:630 start_codon:yes stop_codon:yes gene_type:complete
MNLFLDTISPIPKFSIINKNSIQSIQILNKNSNKISDNIVQVFLKMQRKFILNDKIDNLIVCTGPGSYTGLRIGIAFMYGISISLKIPLIGVSGLELLQFATPKQHHKKTLFLINSTNNQKFYSSYSKIHNQYIINKIIYNHENNCIFNNKFEYNISNSVLDSLLIKMLNINEYKTISFDQIIKSSLKQILKKRQNKIIKPIYIEEKKS